MVETKSAPLAQRAAAEFLGTGALVCVVVGSGIMGARLSSDLGVVLLANTWATVCALFVLITLFMTISGAHFNPVVTAVGLFERTLGWRVGLSYVAAQVAGGLTGAMTANAMFELHLTGTSATDRQSGAILFSEVVATFGLLFVITLLVRTSRQSMIPACVALYIGAAYFFTSSTSFANPAVTIGRSITDSFSGINPGDTPMFIGMQFLGGALGYLCARLIASAP